MRKAVFAGQFYEGSEAALTKQIEECFNDKNGPGDLPLSKRTKKIQAVIAPHAGYQFSGACAAWAYKEIAEAEFPDIFIILGPSHHSADNTISLEGYETPLGLVRADQEFARALMQKNEELKEDPQSQEHSIEVQLPFLQYATKDKMHSLKIVPLVLSSLDYAKLALDIKETLIEQNKTAIIIVSSDFTHYGRNYHHVPFSTNVKKNIYDQDRKAIDFIEKLDADGFIDFVNTNMMTICGVAPIATLLKYIKKSKITLEQYYTSADLETDADEAHQYKNSVSYAAIIFN